MKTKARYEFIDFIRPKAGYWPSPYTVEQAFGVFRWMAETGPRYHAPSRWGTASVKCLLSCQPTCVSFNEITPITGIEDLERRFHYALLYKASPGGVYDRWRTDCGIGIEQSRVISFPHHDPFKGPISEATIQSSLESLLSAKGRVTAQLNKYHRHAKNIIGVRLHLRSTWVFVLDYGYQGSVWHRNLSRQTRGETFVAAMQRAIKELGRLTDPALAGEVEAA